MLTGWSVRSPSSCWSWSEPTEGVSLVGPGGLLSGVTKTVLEAELTEHLGYDPHERVGADNGRNGYRAKTVLTDVGPVEVNVPRDRAGSFEPKLVRKRQLRLIRVDDLVISLVAKGLTTGEVTTHLAEVYGAEVSRETISKITDRVLEGMVDWQNRPTSPTGGGFRGRVAHQLMLHVSEERTHGLRRVGSASASDEAGPAVQFTARQSWKGRVGV